MEIAVNANCAPKSNRLNMIKIKNEYKKFVIIVMSDIFYISLTTFIFFSLVELIRPRFIVAYLNMNGLLMLIVITGAVTVINNEEYK